MIVDYVFPQSTIRQNLAVIPGSSSPRMSACVVGAQYQLNRYGAAEIPGVAFATAGLSIPYEYFEGATATTKASDRVVDLDTVKLFGEKLEASLAAFTYNGGPHFNLFDLTLPNELKISSASVAGTGLAEAFADRPVNVGDIVLVTDNEDVVRRRTVVGLRGAKVNSHYGSNTAANDGHTGNSNYNPVTDISTPPITVVSAPAGWTMDVDSVAAFNATVRGSSYKGRYGEEFTVSVRTGGAPGTATVDIVASSGLWSATNIATVDINEGSFSVTNSAAGGELAGLDLILTPYLSGAVLTQGQSFRFRIFGAYTRISNTQIIADDFGNGYTGKQDTTYIIKVTKGTTGGTYIGAELSISDSGGVDEASTITVSSNTQAIPVGTLGLLIELSLSGLPVQDGLRAGDVYYITAVAATESTTTFDRIILDGPVVDTTVFTDIEVGVAVEFRLPFTGEVASSAAADNNAWTAGAENVALDSGLSLYVAARASGYRWVPFVDAVGKLFNSWRAVVPTDSSKGLFTVSNATDIIARAGVIDPENELAFGLSAAQGGAQGGVVYGINTGGVDLASFNGAYRKLESQTRTVFLAIVSKDPEIVQAARLHVDAMSAPTKKKFRRCYGGTDAPGKYRYLNTKTGGGYYAATVSDYGGQNLLVTHTDGSLDFQALNILGGDLFVPVVGGTEYVIDRVISSTELLLKAGPIVPVSPAVSFTLWHSNTPASQGLHVKAISHQWADRRAMNVWHDGGTRFVNGGEQHIPAMFVACEIAGLRQALPPQRGLTRTELTSVSAVSSCYNKYTDDELNDIASNGVCIVMQEAEGAPVFIRHQLTTDVSHGNLYYEDSPGVVLDYLSFLFADRIDPTIGRKNVVPDTIAELEAIAIDILEAQKTADLESPYGPLIVGYSNLVVAADPILKDRVNISVTVRIGLPMNYVEITFNGTYGTAVAPAAAV